MSDNLLNKLIRSKEIIDLLIEGENPFDSTKDIGEDLINDIKYIRWLHFMSDYVTGEIHGMANKKRTSSNRNGSYKNRISFKISLDAIDKIKLPEHDIGISQFCKHVNEYIDTDVMEPLKAVDMNGYLISKGYLEKITTSDGKRQTKPTELGNINGIDVFDGLNYGVKFYKVTYGEQGKQFLLDILKELMG